MPWCLRRRFVQQLQKGKGGHTVIQRRAEDRLSLRYGEQTGKRATTRGMRAGALYGDLVRIARKAQW